MKERAASVRWWGEEAASPQLENPPQLTPSVVRLKHILLTHSLKDLSRTLLYQKEISFVAVSCLIESTPRQSENQKLQQFVLPNNPQVALQEQCTDFSDL